MPRTFRLLAEKDLLEYLKIENKNLNYDFENIDMTLDEWDACIKLNDDNNKVFLKIECNEFYPNEPMKITINSKKYDSTNLQLDDDLRYKSIDILNKIIYLNNLDLWNYKITFHKVLTDFSLELEKFLK